ncbi:MULTISPECIES: hypothetical protein [unclassified Bacillus (in: firmicutes)]|uniref:hypothetical protein n=1 Tax=unclassified Bacillus (in: firmicutes) TaxID=185979 RepID=UPI000B868B77|nr:MULTISPECIES: hypothetical protein [unclassified Bacillus (in: firmicutes)]
MNLPIIHTNIWDAVIAVPVVMLLTQMVKVFFKVKKVFIPSIALIIGLLISIFISHPGKLAAGILMGWLYGYAAVGSYASLKTTLITYRNKK